jgi:Ca2+-binding RTX toxin-like protein
MPFPSRLLVLSLLVACEVGDFDPIEESTAIIAAGGDPCKDANIRSRANVTKNAQGNFVGTNKRDVIIGTNGPDKIYGLGGDDLICGLDGDDYIDGGDGRDAIHGGAGEDVIHGRGGSDEIWGGPGADVLFGDILDDKIHGDGGNDTMIGGHGTDTFDGGEGNDFMRGDTGNDFFYGGGGDDVASFATALPPGQPEVKNDGSLNEITGVSLDFNGQCNGAGCANGDGGSEPLGDIEQVVGSPFTDRINAGGRTVQSSAPAVAASTVYIAAATDPGGRLADVGVIVLGSAGPDTLQVTGNDTVVNVSNSSAMTPGEGCTAVDANTVRCDVGAYVAARTHRPAPFHYVSVWGDDGADNITVRGDFPREFEAHASGGRNSDHLIGGGEQDVFFTGVNGEDWLEGNDGDDALLSESEHTLAWRNDERPEASQYNDGADTLDAGPGNDQLVADYVCGGHRYIGGPGHDIAGFARSGKHGINAQLGGPASTKTKWWGKAANMDLCGNLEGRWTTFKTGTAADLEVLEASDGPDHLWGDDRANVLWSRGGGDVVYGVGGDDELLGANGNDKLYGGPGNNTIKYGADN